MQQVTTDDLDALLNVLPPNIRQGLVESSDNSELLEIVLDLGRLPEARYPHKELVLSQHEVADMDIDYILSRIGEFSGDNRAGIARTLHRISAMRNREGRIIGLTCRVGRAVFGTVKIIQDLVETGKSVLLLGKPGIGKTTMLREVARVLADNMGKRVMVVDTSNEIAGDGDIPHPAIGHARRMQVQSPTMQHAVMIEAVENHMPEVIIVDEIGTSLEAEAARTIAERGVQLIGTAHGNSLENLMMNPTLSDLVGGIQTVTLGDEEARRRHTQKSILERKAPPTFNILVEIQERNRVTVHPDVTEAVDNVLHSRKRKFEERWVDEEGNIHRSTASSTGSAETKEKVEGETGKFKIYLFGVNKNRLLEAARDKHLILQFAADLKEANLLLTTKHYFIRKPQTIRDAEKAGIPIYAVKSSKNVQLKQCLDTIFWRKRNGNKETDPVEPAEPQVFTEKIEAAENLPGSYIKRLQRVLNKHGEPAQSGGRRPYRKGKI